MDSFVNEKDFVLLSQDHYTFAVLTRILKGECELIRSNHENLLLCHSASHYPVWIWTPDNAADEVKENAWELVCDLRPLSSGYRYNLKYELAEYFIEKAADDGIGAGISMNLFVYDCPSPIPPDTVSDGDIYCCTTNDEEEAAAMIPHFYTEIGEEEPSYERCLEKVRYYIAGKGFFFWKNKNGNTVACCSYKPDGRLASIGSVFTFPDERRKHYAQNLVYQVTRKVTEMGYIPILYTDADYQASKDRVYPAREAMYCRNHKMTQRFFQKLSVCRVDVEQETRGVNGANTSLSLVAMHKESAWLFQRHTLLYTFSGS